MIDRTYTKDVSPDRDGETVSVAGHVHEVRDLGGVVFVIVRDRKGTIQAVFKEDSVEFEEAKEFNREDVVRIEGNVKAAEQAPGGVEIEPRTTEVLSEAEPELPLEIAKDVDSDLSTRLDNRHIDIRKPEVSAVFSLRSKAVSAMREWFEKEDFEEVDTPLLSKGGAEGGADLFPVLYYDEDAFLSQSPQLYKQILVGSGIDRLYEVGKAYRAENFATSRHVSEISMFDVEFGYIEDHHDVMDVQEESLKYTLEKLEETASTELEALGVELEVPDSPFPRINFDRALEILESEYDHVPDDETDLDTRGEKLLGEYFEDQGHPAIFVVGYPEEKFYYMQGVDEEIASRKFDLIYKGLEISSGGQRVHDVDELEAAMEEEGIEKENFDFYLDAFRYGVPPHGGYGLGIDRLIRKVAELDNVKEAILFPRDPDRLSP